MFPPIGGSQEVIAAIINIQFGVKELFQVIGPEDIVVVEEDVIIEPGCLCGGGYFQGETPAVDAVEESEQPVRWEPVDGLHDPARVIIPEVVLYPDESIFFAADDPQVACNGRIVLIAHDRFAIEGHVDIQHPVCFGQLQGDVLAIAAELEVPGLNANDYDIHSE